ncbi:hypothetical protein ACSSS7_001753 [Eimeria intestinalis]
MVATTPVMREVCVAHAARRRAKTAAAAARQSAAATATNSSNSNSNSSSNSSRLGSIDLERDCSRGATVPHVPIMGPRVAK